MLSWTRSITFLTNAQIFCTAVISLLYYFNWFSIFFVFSVTLVKVISVGIFYVESCKNGSCSKKLFSKVFLCFSSYTKDFSGPVKQCKAPHKRNNVLWNWISQLTKCTASLLVCPCTRENWIFLHFNSNAFID